MRCIVHLDVLYYIVIILLGILSFNIFYCLNKIHSIIIIIIVNFFNWKLFVFRFTFFSFFFLVLINYFIAFLLIFFKNIKLLFAQCSSLLKVLSISFLWGLFGLLSIDVKLFNLFTLTFWNLLSFVTSWNFFIRRFSWSSTFVFSFRRNTSGLFLLVYFFWYKWITRVFESKRESHFLFLWYLSHWFYKSFWFPLFEKVSHWLTSSFWHISKEFNL